MVVARPVKIGDHQAECIEAVLLAKRFEELDPGDPTSLIRGL